MAASSEPARRSRARKATSGAKKTAARKAAALGTDGVTFEFEGDEYTVLPSELWSVEILEGIEDQQYVTVVRALLGVEGYGRWKTSGATGTRLLPEFEALINAIMAAVGSPNS